jgi:hypothetical protein
VLFVELAVPPQLNAAHPVSPTRIKDVIFESGWITLCKIFVNLSPSQRLKAIEANRKP